MKSERAIRAAAEIVECVPGVRSVQTNARTGSLLVQFDPKQVSAIALLYRLEQCGYASTALPHPVSAESKARGPVRSIGRRIGQTLVEAVVERSTLALIAALV